MDVVSEFTRMWYEREQRRTWRATTWLGVPSQQAPTDLWVYQEMMVELRPSAVIEIGVKRGGTTLWFASLADLIGEGLVVGVDIGDRADPPVKSHPRITLIVGDSPDEQIARRVRDLAGDSPLVLLDSNHTADHVLQELNLYAPLVAPGGYVIVNDTQINGHPSLPDWGPGPWEAVERFLAENDDFEPDRTREKHLLTQSPRGFLRRR